MAIGKSCRVVIDLTQEQKKAIHEAIKKDGKNLKQWFLEKVKEDFPEIKQDYYK
jgi:hypothetical protein